MPEFSETSKKRLATCHPRLQVLFELVVTEYDCSVLTGYRNMAQQQAAYRDGFSKVDWPDSQHNLNPSWAVDVAPYPIDWNDIERFYHFGGFVESKAMVLGIDLRWGGDWDRDRELRDQRFFDLAHFELVS